MKNQAKLTECFPMQDYIDADRISDADKINTTRVFMCIAFITSLTGMILNCVHFKLAQIEEKHLILVQATLGVQTFASRNFREVEKSRNLRHLLSRI